MRILFVTTSTYLGGAERNLAALVSSLKDAEVRVISLYPLGEIGRELNAVSLNSGYLPSLSALIKLKKEIQAFKPDIVHAFLYKAIQMCRLIKDGSFKLITTPHTNYENKSACLVFLDKVLAANDDISLAESASTYKFLIERQKYKKEKTFLFENIVDEKFKENSALRSTARKELNAGNKTVFVCAARLSKEKGHKYLLQAFASLREKNKNTALWLLGDGPEKERLLKMPHEGVEFLGIRTDVEKYLNGADVFVLPSLSESRPLALLEAKAVGLPAIATDVGDSAEIYKHGKTGFILSPKDPVLLSIFMQEMCSRDVRDKFREEIKNGTTLISDRLGDAYMGIAGKVVK